MLDAKHAQQIGVAATLFAHTFIRSDLQKCSVGPRRSRDHVFQEFLVPRRVNNGIAAARSSKRNLSRVDSDVLLLLLEQRIEQESEFKFHPLSSAGLFNLVDLAFWKRTGVVQNPANERGLAVVNVADENDPQRARR